MPPTLPPLGDFDLGGWSVHPALNRLRRGEISVRLEPKMMDVLVALARRRGQVVSKDELAAEVWAGLYITESVITRAIAGLRRALQDDARTPRFIETIAKRGYRLVATPLAPGPAIAAAAGAEPSGMPLGGAPPLAAASPYTPGQWVRGARFHGREALLAEVLDGPRNGLWLLGSRAIGKTSTLRQLAHLAGRERPRRYLPLFWDLQGCEQPADFDSGFRDAVAEVEGELAAAQIEPATAGAGDSLAGGFLEGLGRLRRAARARGLVLLLLLDEAEELLALRSRAPAALRKLRRALQGQEGVRTVLAAGSRLWELGGGREPDDTSPFLHGFAPPVYLGCLEGAAALRLAVAGGAGEADAAEAVRRSGGHPYLLQLLLARHRELGDLARAATTLLPDPGVRALFRVDFGLLSTAEREVLAAAASNPGVEPAVLALPAGERAAAVLHLERLGMIRSGAGLEVAIPVLAEWLREAGGPGAPEGAAQPPVEHKL
jgi:DNA-binding winged helix-turn-helix (wHTH) protein